MSDAAPVKTWFPPSTDVGRLALARKGCCSRVCLLLLLALPGSNVLGASALGCRDRVATRVLRFLVLKLISNWLQIFGAVRMNAFMEPGPSRPPAAIAQKFSDWPTFPQLYAGGELVGGCDIISAMADSGDLKPTLDSALAAAQSAGTWDMAARFSLPSDRPVWILLPRVKCDAASCASGFLYEAF